MAYCTVSISSGAAKSIYGDSQFPIKSYIEKKGEGFEQESVLKRLFRMDKSKNFAEKFSGDTAMGDFEPVGEGGAYPSNGFEEGFSKMLEHETWKSQFSITREMVDDAKIYSMKRKASSFMTAHDRTREKFGRMIYAGALAGTDVQIGAKTFNCCGADGKKLFAADHPAKVKGAAQSNLFKDAFSVTTLGTAESRMQNLCGDNQELLSVSPDTIWIPNDAALKNTVFAAIGADKDPATANNAFNYQYGRWNVIVDPYLTVALKQLGIPYAPWFLLDSKFIQEQDGAVWLDRKKLEIRSEVDTTNDNNVWKGYSRFCAGFVDWRFILAGGVTGAGAL